MASGLQRNSLLRITFEARIVLRRNLSTQCFPPATLSEHGCSLLTDEEHNSESFRVASLLSCIPAAMFTAAVTQRCLYGVRFG